MTGTQFEAAGDGGYIYMMSSRTWVDDKIHARSIGP